SRDSADSLVLCASKTITRGEQLHFSYHSTHNRFWVCEYGFYMDDNEFEELDLSMEICEVLRGFEEDLRGFGYWDEYTISKEGEVSWRIQVALRVLVLNEEEFTELVNGRNDGEEVSIQVNELL